MSDYDDAAILGIDPEATEGLDPHIRSALKGAADSRREAQQAQARLTHIERELAFTKAGIPDTPLNATLAKTYDGDNDPTAIKAYFESLGVELTAASAGSPTEPAPSGPSDAELADQRRLANVSAASGGEAPVEYRDALMSAKTTAEVLAVIANAPADAGIGAKSIQ